MGVQVIAYTYPDEDRELPPEKVTGKLQSRYVPSLEYKQYFVNGVMVDPETIERVEDVS